MAKKASGIEMFGGPMDGTFCHLLPSDKKLRTRVFESPNPKSSSASLYKLMRCNKRWEFAGYVTDSKAHVDG